MLAHFLPSVTFLDALPVINHKTSVADVLQALRDQRRIPSLPSFFPAVYYDTYRWSRLNNDDILWDVGVRDLSVVHIKYLVIGGARRPPSSGMSARYLSTAPAYQRICVKERQATHQAIREAPHVRSPFPVSISW